MLVWIVPRYLTKHVVDFYKGSNTQSTFGNPFHVCSKIHENVPSCLLSLTSSHASYHVFTLTLTRIPGLLDPPTTPTTPFKHSDIISAACPLNVQSPAQTRPGSSPHSSRLKYATLAPASLATGIYIAAGSNAALVPTTSIRSIGP